jgi:hypothetical protein
MTPKESLK